MQIDSTPRGFYFQTPCEGTKHGRVLYLHWSQKKSPCGAGHLEQNRFSILSTDLFLLFLCCWFVGLHHLMVQHLLVTEDNLLAPELCSRSGKNRPRLFCPSYWLSVWLPPPRVWKIQPIHYMAAGSVAEEQCAWKINPDLHKHFGETGVGVLQSAKIHLIN